MRRILIIACALALAGPVHAGGENKKSPADEGTDIDKRTLSAASVVKYLTPYADSIRDCYEKHGLKQKNATGDLRLELIIHRNGSVYRLNVWAPGVKGKGLSQCLQKLSKTWSFPPRRGFTHVLVPFFYLRTEAKGAGPTITCWSIHGCPKKRRAQRAKHLGTKGKGKDKDAKGKGKGKGAKPAKSNAKKGKTK